MGTVRKALGLLLGQGFGGVADMFGLLPQGLRIAGAVMLALRYFHGRNAAQPAMADAGPDPDSRTRQMATASAARAPRGR